MHLQFADQFMRWFLSKRILKESAPCYQSRGCFRKSKMFSSVCSQNLGLLGSFAFHMYHKGPETYLPHLWLCLWSVCFSASCRCPEQWLCSVFLPGAWLIQASPTGTQSEELTTGYFYMVQRWQLSVSSTLVCVCAHQCCNIRHAGIRVSLSVMLPDQ